MFRMRNRVREQRGAMVAGGLVLAVWAATAWAVQQTAPNPDPARFANEIRTFETWDTKNSFPADAVLFAGSSSIRMWPTHESFPQWPVINRGFGGAHISDVLHYASGVVLPYKAKVIVFYAGDNDIADNKSPAQVLGDFKTFVQLVHEKQPQTPIIYLSIKASRSRWKFWPQMKEANGLIREFCEYGPRLYYVDVATPLLGPDGEPRADLLLKDGLHLNADGYAVWTREVAPVIERALKSVAN